MLRTTYAHSGSQPWLGNPTGEFSKIQIPGFPQFTKSESLDRGPRHIDVFKKKKSFPVVFLEYKEDYYMSRPLLCETKYYQTWYY